VPNVQENPFLPPGAPDPTAPKAYNVPSDAPIGESHSDTPENGEATEGTGEQYPAVPETPVITAEEHAAKEKAATDERIARSNRATGPKRMSEREKQQVAILLSIMPEDDSPSEYVFKLESMPTDLADSFFKPGNDRNLAQRGLVTMVMDEETKQPIGVRLTEIAMHLYFRQSSKDGAPQTKTTTKEGKPVAAGGRTTNKYTGLRIKVMVTDNPRQVGTQGYYAWDLYKDGMTYHEYMASKNFRQVQTGSGSMFRGPGRNHFDWDLMHGFISLYNENEPETNEDGSPNPKYWAINNKRAENKPVESTTT
jgi:hypothetical protein